MSDQQTPNTQRLVRIVPTQCSVREWLNQEKQERCPNTAYWQYGDFALCIPCMQAMAAMNSDNAEAFAFAFAWYEQVKETQCNTN